MINKLYNEMYKINLDDIKLQEVINYLILNNHDIGLKMDEGYRQGDYDFYVDKEIMDVLSKEFNLSIENIKIINIVEGIELLDFLGLKKFYYNIDDKFIRDRIDFIKQYTENDEEKAEKIFDEEKEKSLSVLYELTRILKTTDIKIIYDETFEPEIFHGRSNMSKYNYEGIEYIYKEFTEIKINNDILITGFVINLINLFRFINNMNLFYFNENIEIKDIKYTISIIRLLNRILIFKQNGYYKVGYLMEDIDGIDVRKYKESNPDEYYEIIIPAIHSLIDYLTDKKFLIIDFALDNVMWIPSTKTLVLIDINHTSFYRQREAELYNLDQKKYDYYNKYFLNLSNKVYHLLNNNFNKKMDDNNHHFFH